MRRADRQVTDPQEINQIIKTAKVLHLGLFDGNFPYVVPLHYGYEQENGVFVFFLHSAKDGHKLEQIRKNPHVCVELECEVSPIPGGDIPCRYGASFASVIGRGTAEIVGDEALVELHQAAFGIRGGPGVGKLLQNPGQITFGRLPAPGTFIEIGDRQQPFRLNVAALRKDRAHKVILRRIGIFVLELPEHVVGLARIARVAVAAAGELEKPNKVITLFPQEFERKLWPLPVGELFMVGRATAQKLTAMGIRTIGDLAKADPAFLIRKLGKQGGVLWQFANGKDAGGISSAPAPNKSYGNAMTTPHDVTDFSYADQVLLSLCETVGTRLRRDEQAGSCLTIHLRTSAFENWSHQRQLSNATNVTQELYAGARELLRAAWDGKTPLRQIGIQITRLSDTSVRQASLFDAADNEKLSKLDKTVDALREKYGEQALFRAAFLSGDTPNMAGGLSKHRRTGITKPIDEPEQYVLAHLKEGKIKL